MKSPDKIWMDTYHRVPGSGYATLAGATIPLSGVMSVEYLRADGPTVTAWKEALRTLGADPDSIARGATP